MVAVPAATPVTVPVEPTVAADALVLLHVPPLVASFNDVVAPPSHTLGVPVIDAGAEGSGFTVTLAVAVPQVFV